MLKNNKYKIFSSFQILLLGILILSACNHQPSDKFDSRKWKKSPEIRYQMARNIMNSKMLIGMSKENVIELLGTDTENGPCTNCMGYSTNNPNLGFSIDHEVLNIDFDQNKNVTNVSFL